MAGRDLGSSHPLGPPRPNLDGSGGQVPQGGLAAASPNPLMVRVFPDGAGEKAVAVHIVNVTTLSASFFLAVPSAYGSSWAGDQTCASIATWAPAETTRDP